jgi:hypothetical protein
MPNFLFWLLLLCEREDEEEKISLPQNYSSLRAVLAWDFIVFWFYFFRIGNVPSDILYCCLFMPCGYAAEWKIIV